ncbi:MAG: HAMP domain-containing protein [Verrucomicrobiota bacterium]
MKFSQKLQFLLVLLVGITCGLLLWLSLRKANRLAFELIQEKVYSIAVSTAPRIDGDLVEALTSPDQDGSSEYNLVRDKLREVRDANDSGALPVRFIYIIRPLENGEWEYVIDAEEDGEDKSYLGDIVEFEFEKEKPDLHLSRTDEEFATDSFGVWLSAFSPIRNSEGEPVAVVGVDIAAERIKELLRRLLIGDLIAMVVALILAAALAGWLSRRVTRPLIELGDFVREIGRGNYSSRVEVDSTDEFGELAEAVNQMAEGLEERESLRGALVHYVRSQAADAKLTGSEEVDETTRPFTALVAELCGFGQLSSRLGSDRVFALLNEYFSTMIDVLLRHGGSLERSSDESVIAVFGITREDPHQERHAIEAALEMQGALEKLMEEWGIETNVPISLAIGVHTGDGTVRASGTSEQVDHDSVIAIVETASRIAEVAKEKKHRLTVSDTTAERLHHTFPLEPVDEDSLEFGLFRVSMPQMKFA